jgi:hypothetical protein
VRDNDQFCDGTYVGPILDIKGQVASQRINRQGETVSHSLEALSRPVKIGDLLEISYRGGLAHVTELGRARGIER